MFLKILLQLTTFSAHEKRKKTFLTFPNNETSFDMCLHTSCSQFMKFQSKLLTRTPFTTVFVAVARKLGNPTSPQVQIFGAKIYQFLNEMEI
jgi:hypothetical protein